ncbi:hypothetical protein NPX13_g3314 [Xylaria arbuscula]|uniref:Uncharacterized protein n=1 Tax=Xylaria arbuscula TaxID=114810 RepID=A0A9W8TQ80_9PEZI|nr:hypothetical protein NPX13_g3314 [Xylaria arbuscula]
MDNLPSYIEATSRCDWLSLVAPFVPASSWTSCCLIDSRFYNYFARRLWQDPLVTIRQLGLHPNDDLAWYRHFIHKHVSAARFQTRCLVKSLDFRDFALRPSGLYSTDASERAISESFKSLPNLFPKLVCLLIEGHPELDPSFLATARIANSHSLEVLDLARCRQELTPRLFFPQTCRDLVYLDVSYIPGSLRSAVQTSLNPTYLPELRILKAQGREVDDATAQLLCETFRLQLWSIDLSGNKLTDNSVDVILTHCFSSLSFRNDAHFEVEGKVVAPRNLGSRQYGPFEFIQESSYSAAFTHPERHLADAPVYARRTNQSELQEWQTVRLDGASPSRRDDVGAVKEVLLKSALLATSEVPKQPVLSLHMPRGGITHLYLNNNNFTAAGVGRLLQLSLGRLEHFECDRILHRPPILVSDRSQQQLRVFGAFGLSHLLRPVFSSNLQSLRIHHSLVTQVPVISTDNLPPTTSLKVSETILFRNVSRVYPQRFVPDMNPRIASLTLTNIPTRSVGRVIEQLVSFLDQTSIQQEMIERTRSDMDNQRAAVLSGLRHIRLELDPDFSDDILNPSSSHNIDYDKLLDPGSDDFTNDTFSFFVDDRRSISSQSTGQRVPEKKDTSHENVQLYSDWKSGRLRSPPYSDTNSHFITYHQDASSSWTGNFCSVPVWIGPGTIGPHSAVNEYMWNLQDARLRTDVGPATPSHVVAGVPPFTYVFYAAWNAMIFPKNLPAAVQSCSTEPLRDVTAAIKEHRMKTRGTSRHWNGKLELARSNQSLYHASNDWR